MANVLGELFGNIAAAIREKTGDTATMKPAEFPDKISAIETGGGGGTLVGARGSFTATGTTQTITHGLGTIPLYAYFFPTSGLGASASKGAALFGFGCGQEAADILGITADYQYVAYIISLASDGYSWEIAQWTADDTIETTLSRPVCNANDATMQFGCSTAKLVSGVSYSWFAMGYKVDE